MLLKVIKNWLKKMLKGLLWKISPIYRSTKRIEKRIGQIESTLRDMNQFSYSHHVVSGWTDKWKIFHRENFSEIERYMDKLKRGLDKRSCEIIDTIWYRQTELLPQIKDVLKVRYNLEEILTQDEKNEKNITMPEEQIRKEFHIPKNLLLEVPIFHYHSGLTFVPKEVRDSLMGKDLIDGGAYWGDSSIIFTKYNPSRIFAFEPNQKSYEELIEIINQNSMQNMVIPINMGLSSEENLSMPLTVFSRESVAANFYGIKSNFLQSEEEKEITDVEVTTIDEFSSLNNLDLGLIKLDIEGSEFEAIQGALKSIKKFKPVLLISIYHKPEDFFYIKPLLEDLDLEYRFLIRKIMPFLLTSDIVLIAY